MKLLDLFSGIGGFHKGLSDAGLKFDKVYYSEIDKHAVANYKYNYETAEHIGGVESILTSGIERPNIITFGSPCQDFSLAGKRRGLGGERSSLIQYALSAISHFKPDIFVWENVKGTFSSNNSEDFWAIIKAFADIGGYGLEWQLVNTSWLLPQNRERIYLVGHLATSFRNWKPIFPIGETNKIYNTTKENKKEIRPNLLTLTARGYSSWNGNFIKEKEPSFTSTSQDKHGIFDGKILRTLTEIEYERLQGYPDNWTKYGNYDGKVKEIPMTQRYKMLGNAVTAKMVELIGKRIKENL